MGISNTLLYFILSVAVAGLVYVHIQNEHLKETVKAMEQNMSMLASSFKMDTEKHTRERRAMSEAVKSDMDHLQTFKRSVEDAIFQNKLHALEIKDLQETSSELHSLKKSVDGVVLQSKQQSMDIQSLTQKLDSVIRNDDEFRIQVDRFKDEMRDYQRRMNDRNPLMEIFTGFVDKVLSPFRQIQKLLS